MLAVFPDDLIVAPDSMVPGDAKIQVIVLRAGNVRPEPADSPDDCRSKTRRSRRPDVVLEKEVQVVILNDDGTIPCGLSRAIGTDKDAAPGGQRAVVTYSKHRTPTSSARGRGRSSESRKTTYSPVARLRPSFRAVPWPWFACEIQRTPS